MTVHRIPPGSVFRERLAFSRAVRVGDVIHVAATGATDAQGALTALDAAGQTREIFAQITKALAELDANLADITRLRIYLRDYAVLDEILSVQHPLFDTHPPATAVVCVAGFHVDGMHVYVEADAIAQIVGTHDTPGKPAESDTGRGKEP